MVLVCCVDDIMGMAFFGKRQSRDRILYEDISHDAGDSLIHMENRSEALFENTSAHICPSEYPFDKAAPGEYLFLEFSNPSTVEARVEKIILYRWNRRYQSDLKFDIELENWTLESSCDFPGFSHERITKEVYIHA